MEKERSTRNNPRQAVVCSHLHPRRPGVCCLAWLTSRPLHTHSIQHEQHQVRTRNGRANTRLRLPPRTLSLPCMASAKSSYGNPHQIAELCLVLPSDGKYRLESEFLLSVMQLHGHLTLQSSSSQCEGVGQLAWRTPAGFKDLCSHGDSSTHIY